MHVIATFPDRASAELAVRDLADAGFARSGMTLALNSQPSSIHGGAVLSVDAGARSEEARILLRKNNAINLQDAGEVVPLQTGAPHSAPPAPPVAPDHAMPASGVRASPQARAAYETYVAEEEAERARKSQETATFGGFEVVPRPIPIVTPPPSALGGMNPIGVDLQPQAEPQETRLDTDLPPNMTATAGPPLAGTEFETTSAPHGPGAIPGLDPAASADAMRGGSPLPPVDDPTASENTNPEEHLTTR